MATFDSKIKRAVINFSASGDNVLVAAVPNTLISVVGLLLVVGGATNLTFKDGGNAISGPLPMLANGAIALDVNSGLTWFLTSSTVNNLVLNNSSAVQVSGVVYYTQE